MPEDASLNGDAPHSGPAGLGVRVSEMQAKLHRWAVADPGRRFDDLFKPSDHAVRRIRERLRTEMRVLLGSNAASVLHTLTAIVRGWAAYYRIGVSSEVFSALDDYMWKLLYKWIRPVQPLPQQPVGLR